MITQEIPGQMPLSEIYNSCLRNLQLAESLTRLWVINNLPPSRRYSYAYDVLNKPSTYNWNNGGTYGKIFCSLEHSTADNYIFRALSKSAVPISDPRYYRAPSIYYRSKEHRLCLELPVFDSELRDYIPPSIDPNRALLSYEYHNPSSPTWTAMQFDSSYKISGVETIGAQPDLDEMFLRAAQQGQLPGIIGNVVGAILPPPSEYPQN